MREQKRNSHHHRRKEAPVLIRHPHARLVTSLLVLNIILSVILSCEDLKTQEALRHVVKVLGCLAQVGNTWLDNTSEVWCSVIAVASVERTSGAGIRTEGSDLLGEVGR